MNEELTKGTIVPDIEMGNSSSSIGTVVPDINAGGGIQTAPAISTTTSPAKDYFKSFGINTDGGKLTDEAWESIYYTVNSNKNKNKSDTEKIGIIKEEIQDRLNPGFLAKAVSGISKATSNLPEKMAGVLETVSTPISQLPNNISNLVNSITGKGEQIDTSMKNPVKNYEEIKAVFDPNQTVIVDKSGKPLKNGEFIQNIVQGSQDALGRIVVAGGLQSIPGFGQALSSAYWSAISADERLQKNGGKLGIKDIAPILIDTIGDSIIGNQIGKLLGLGGDVAKNTARMIEQSTLVEGGTEVAQTILKNVYDIATARNQEERKEKWEELKQYFTDPKHGVALEFLVGAISGGIAGAGAGAIGQMAQNAGVDMTAKPYTPQEIADMTKDTIGSIKQQQEVRTQAKAIQNKDSAIRGIANDMLGNKTKGGNLENSPIDVASKHLTNVFSDMTLKQMENIIKGGEKTAYKTFGKEYNKSYNEVQNKINNILSRPVIMNTTIDGTSVMDELLSDDGDLAFQRKQLQAEAQNAINQGEIETRQNDDGTITYIAKTKSGGRIADELNGLSDDITNKRRKFTIGEIEQLRKDYNRGFKPNGQPYTDYEKAIGRKFIAKMRDLMYEKVNEMEPGFRELAEKRADYEAMRRLLEKAVATEDTYNEKGSGIARGAIEGAMRTIDPADAIFALTPGGLTRTGVEALFGAIMGAVRSKKNVGKNLIKNMKTLYNAKAVEDLTSNTINSAGNITTIPAVRNVDIATNPTQTEETEIVDTENQDLIQQADQPLQIENSSRKKFYTNEEFNNLMKQEDKRFTPITTQKIKGKNVKISPDQLRMFKKSDGTQTNDVLSDDVKTKITELFNKRGVEVSFEELPNDVDAMWSMDKNGNRSVKFNVNNESDKTIYNTAIHELVHDLTDKYMFKVENEEDPYSKKYYMRLNTQNLLGHLNQISKEVVEDATKKVEKLYKFSNSEDDKIIKNEEIVAEILSNKLGDEDFVNKLISEKPNLFYKIYNWVIDKLSQIMDIMGVNNATIKLEKIKNDFIKAYNTHDIQGRKLSENQSNYFKNSKVRVDNDVNRPLIPVYHTTTDKVSNFTVFDPRGTENYKYGNDIVNFYTDSRDMSESYAKTVRAPYDAITQKVDDSNIEIVLKNIGYEIGEQLQIDGNNIETSDGDIIAKFKNKDDMYRNLIKTLQEKLNDKYDIKPSSQLARKHLIYTGYLDIKNPYIIDANGGNWNSIIDPESVNNIDNANKNMKNVLELMPRLDKIFEDYNSELSNLDLSEAEEDEIEEINNKAMNKIQNARKKVKLINKNGIEKVYSLAELFEEYSDLYELLDEPAIYLQKNNQERLNSIIDILKYGYDENEIDIDTPMTTNDIVKRVIENNENDGVIIKNVIDYGGMIKGETSVNSYAPHDIYVTFNSNQFKAIDNKNPTSDPDIRYKKSSK